MQRAPLLRREIGEQPDAVARLFERERASVERYAREVARGGVRFALIAARGTSDNAARYAQYALGYAARLPVALAAPSLTTLYHRPPRTKGALVIGISQSGRSPDVVETVAAARRGGAFTLAIVNDTDSPLARAAAEVLPLHAGREVSVAATKTYTAQLAAVALLSAALSGRRRLLAEVGRMPEALERALATEDAAAREAKSLTRASRMVVLARGINTPTAHEIALKLKELALVLAEPYSSADFRHGPIALAEPRLPAIVVSPPGNAARAELAALMRRLRRRGSPVVAIGTRGAGGLSLPEVPELLSPLVAVVPGQLLALHLALARGLDPDRPRGLRKVTETT